MPKLKTPIREMPPLPLRRYATAGETRILTSEPFSAKNTPGRDYKRVCIERRTSTSGDVIIYTGFYVYRPVGPEGVLPIPMQTGIEISWVPEEYTWYKHLYGENLSEDLVDRLTKLLSKIAVMDLTLLHRFDLLSIDD